MSLGRCIAVGQAHRIAYAELFCYFRKQKKQMMMCNCSCHVEFYSNFMSCGAVSFHRSDAGLC